MKGNLNNGIPVSVSLGPALESEDFKPQKAESKKRLIFISALAVIIAFFVAFIAKFLVYLIDLFTNISFFGNFSIDASNPADNHCGIFVIFIPAIGGLIVGLMALYGSKAIRGHGIPEAMEQILTNKSKIKPSIIFLKPISSAISIGTGGPFGAEGPIIATGGAFGSTFGQLLKISDNERKILLAAGATAGMSAIFGSPIAGIFLAIELLLFEFSPRSFIPVALACITGAAGHHLLFKPGYVFAVGSALEAPSNTALFLYCLMGIAIGLFSIVITKVVYGLEDLFEKTPVHWTLWPAIGGLVVGIIGYFAPRTLGVGYNNITDILNGNMPFKLILSLCFLKFVSWAVSLGSGTSGGTLAPLLTIGSATGALLAIAGKIIFPSVDISVSMAALIGMSAMFAGASRAFLTSIIFALETTGESSALLPLLGACSASYFISFFLMKNSIMTEKIRRRGVKTPDSYEPDLLEKFLVKDVLKTDYAVIDASTTIRQVRDLLSQNKENPADFFIVADKTGEYKGLISYAIIMNARHPVDMVVDSLAKNENIAIPAESTLKKAVELMAFENVDVLPVTAGPLDIIEGILTYKDILGVYKKSNEEFENKQSHISLKRNTKKIWLKGKKFFTAFGPTKKK